MGTHAGGSEPTGGEAGAACQLGLVGCFSFCLFAYAAKGKPCSRGNVGWLHATTYGCTSWCAFVALGLGLHKRADDDPLAGPPDTSGDVGLLLMVAGWSTAGALWCVPVPVWSACGIYRRSCVTSLRLWRQSSVSPYAYGETESKAADDGDDGAAAAGAGQGPTTPPRGAQSRRLPKPPSEEKAKMMVAMAMERGGGRVTSLAAMSGSPGGRGSPGTKRAW
eukprot:SAG22_NODE_1234_length_5061_cov_4.711004_6_plen_221_part_00